MQHCARLQKMLLEMWQSLFYLMNTLSAETNAVFLLLLWGKTLGKK